LDSNTATFTAFNWTTETSFSVTFQYAAPVLIDHFLLNVSGAAAVGNPLESFNLSFVVESSSDGTTFVVQSSQDKVIGSVGADYRFGATSASSYYPFPTRGITSGTGGIYGIVSEDSVALPNRPVYLFERDSFFKVGYTTTDNSGGYGFDGLNTNSEFLVMSVDPSGPPYKNAIVWDRIKPINTLGAQTPADRFWARRFRDPAFGITYGYLAYSDGITYNQLISAQGGTPFIGVEYGINYPPVSSLDNYSFSTAAVAGGAFKLLSSTRGQLTDNTLRYGINSEADFGIFGVNAAAQPANYNALTFEYVFVPPVTGESDLFITFTTNQDSGASNEVYGGSYSLIAAGVTLQVTPTVVNVRIPLAGANRSVVRATHAVIQGTVTHITVVYLQDNYIKLYYNGVLTQTTAITGAGRLWTYAQYLHSAAYAYENYDQVYTGSVACRAVNGFNLAGSGHNVLGNTTYPGIPRGWGGQFGCASFFGRAFSDADVTNLYDSFINPTTHVVLPTMPGYAGEVEADNPVLYLRLNDLTAPNPGYRSVCGMRGLYFNNIAGTLFAQTPAFVAGQTAIKTSAGGLYTWNTPALPSQVFTLETFVNFTSVSVLQMLWGTSRYQAVGAMGYIQLLATGKIALTLTDQSGQVFILSYSHTALVVNTNYHIVVTYDPWYTQLSNLYIDGVLVSTLAATSMPDFYYNRQMSIGCLTTTGPTVAQQVQGYIGEFALYNAVVPAERVAAHYAARNN
jgi:hypothetical protein